MPTTAAPTTTTSVEVLPETSVEAGQTDAPGDLVAAEALVEEVSIDGMCGVY